ncbi:MAG: alpha/beta hydrolase [Asgard group archaeon]|nr:alpha/beta hydrolase [Asgard group archaeon]
MSYETKTIILSDKRKLGFFSIGSETGEPIFYFHGWPGTRLDISCLHNQAKKLGVRIISIDRPGVGYSDFQKKRSLVHLPSDIVELADALEIKQFSILGFSTGGLYAIECFLQIPERIKKIGLVSATPYFKVEWPKKVLTRRLKFLRIITRFPLLFRGVLRVLSDNGLNNYKRNKEKAFNKALEKLIEADRDYWNKPEIKSWFLDEYIPDMLKSSRKGIAYDLYLLGKSIAFPQEKKVFKNDTIPIYFFHGKKDRVVISLASVEQQKLFSNSEIILFEDTGHKAIYRKFLEIIEKILS